MRVMWRRIERYLLLTLVATLAVSTGVASVGFPDQEVTGGHTAYLALVRERGPGEGAEGPPVEYGLAKHREVWLFGVYSRTRTLDEDSNRMVFGWNSEAPDPRGDPTLMPTGQFARVVDRGGLTWTVHEFSYAGAGVLHHAYGVRVGPVQEDALGRYNYVLTYRTDRLFPEPTRAELAPAAAGPTTPDLDLATETLTVPTPQTAPQPPTRLVRIGDGPVPVGLAVDQAAPGTAP